MKVVFQGHACFTLEYDQFRLIIDPFLTGNPTAVIEPDEIKVDYILLTHAHNDHFGDTIEIAKQNQAQVICSHEAATWLGWKGIQAHGMSIGGSFSFDFGRVQMTPAFHGNSYIDEQNQQIIYMGMPAGLVIQLGKHTIYHAGDTSLYSDMQLLKRKYDIDLALLPIGDNFTMGPEDALQAAEWVGAKRVVPIHYNTFPPIQQDGQNFIKQLAKRGIEGILLQVGEAVSL